MEQGDPVPELKVTPDKYLPHRYAGASGDFNPIHIDQEFAKQVGLPGNILHGLYMMGLVARANAGLANGDPRALKRKRGVRPHPPTTTNNADFHPFEILFHHEDTKTRRKSK